ncbi:MAG: M15 family metallopeptidase [Bacteroidia bacterium]|nr:M15 family metallopeptidase [Bacteroidia bacterium]
MRAFLLIFPFLLIGLSCTQENSTSIGKNKIVSEQKDSIIAPKTVRDSSDYEKLFVKSGLVNICEFDPDIRVVLLYNTDKNFLGKSFYKGLDQCYLPCDVATKLNHAQKFLKQEHPFYNLIVFDATRPAHIQKMMWDSLKMKPIEKYNYVARPDELSLHNFGAAVDVGIINENGVLLDMGTPFDFFGELAQPKLENEMYSQGKLSKDAYKNRLKLREIMKKAGFTPITSEWWHFNACTKLFAAENYTLIP